MIRLRPGELRLAGVTAQKMAAEKPSAAVGTARGMSIRVSNNCLPRNFFRTRIQAMGSPTRKSMRVTMAAISNEARMASVMSVIIAGSFRTRVWMASQLVKA